ncbi:MAG: caspase family protein [Acidobacteria bacterium]|nr:caspase family protein [Acidobacteriota bacterium]
MKSQFRFLQIIFYSLTFMCLTAEAQQQELYVQSNHSDVVRAVAVSPNGQLAASGSRDGTVRLWDVQKGTVVRTLGGHSGIVHSLLFFSDRVLLSGSTREIKSWDVLTGKLLRDIPSNRTVTSLALSADGKLLAFAAIDRVIVLDLAERKSKELRVVEGEHVAEPYRVAFRPTTTGDPMLAATFDNTVVLWNARTGEKLDTLEHFATAEMKSVAFSPDGKLLATGGTDFWYLWDVEKRERLFRGKSVPYGLAFSPDGKTIATSNMEMNIEVWNVSDGKEALHIDVKNNIIEGIVFSPDGKLLIGGGYQVSKGTSGLDASFRIWDAATGAERQLKSGKTSSLEALALSPDGKLLAVGGKDKKVRLWNLASGQVEQPLGDLKSILLEMAFTPDGKFLATTDMEDSTRLWNMTTRRESASKINFGAPAYSPDGKLFATVEKDNVIALRDTKTLKPLHLLSGHKSGIYVVAFSHDGKLAASGSDDGEAKLWDTATGKEVRTLTGHQASVRTIAFSPNDTLLATAGNDSVIKLWDMATGKELRSIAVNNRRVRALSFTPDGKRLINGGLSDSESPDRRMRVSKDFENKTQVWDVATGRLVYNLSGHNSNIHYATISADGRFIFTASEDGEVKIWRMADGKEAATLISLDDGEWLVATPDGLFDGSPAAWQKIIWRFGETFNYAPVEAFFSDFFYPGLLAEILSGKEPRPSVNIAQKDIRQPVVSLKQTASSKDGRNITVSIEVEEAKADDKHAIGSGAQDVRLFRNGSLVKVFRGDVLKGKTGATLEVTLPVVAGENQLTAYAFNRENIKSADASLIIKGDEKLRRKGALYLLAVGVNTYANPQYNLKYAVADATEFGAEVKRQQMRLQAYGRVEVIALLDRQATKQGITQNLNNLAELAQPEDTVIVYFAGHGTAQRNQFFLIPHDLGYTGARKELTPEGLQTILERSISDRELEDAFEKIDAGQLLFVIDACNSGQALEAEEKRRGPMNSKGLAQLAYEKGMYILTAAQSYQAAMEASKLGHGYLTYALVEEGLKKGAADTEPRDGAVAAREWLDYATERVPQMQLEKMQAGRILEQEDVAFVEGEEKESDPAKRSAQHPRVFYRRETESRPFVIARTQGK